jgi:hypothetical protein
VQSSGNPGPTVAIQATGPTLSVLARMAAVAEKVELRHVLGRALAPFVADVLANEDFQREVLREWGDTTKDDNRCQDGEIRTGQGSTDRT